MSPKAKTESPTERPLLGYAAVWGFTFALTLPLNALPNESDHCYQAAQAASQKIGVPFDVLEALTLTETGRTRGGQFQPWPWAVNFKGQGQWFDTADDALSQIYTLYKSGSRNFDVGCFQINFKWHGKAFSSLDEMLDPTANAVYAAKFVKRLKAELGDWSSAAGAYHSRTPELAEKYVARFEQNRSKPAPIVVAARDESPPKSTLDTQTPSSNAFPLLQGRIGGETLGSLVPLATSDVTRRLIDVTTGG